MSPWRYGNSATEAGEIFIYVGILAFPPKAVITNAPDVCLMVGMPSVGFSESSSGNAKSAHLVGWGVAHLLGWQAMSRNTAPPPPRGLDMDSIFFAPHLSGRNSPYASLPKPSYSFAAAPAVSSTYASPACRADGAQSLASGLGLAQRAA